MPPVSVADMSRPGLNPSLLVGLVWYLLGFIFGLAIGLMVAS